MRTKPTNAYENIGICYNIIVQPADTPPPPPYFDGDTTYAGYEHFLLR
jgi:hypothetical protein